jgi:hypothetical protein
MMKTASGVPVGTRSFTTRMGCYTPYMSPATTTFAAANLGTCTAKHMASSPQAVGSPEPARMDCHMQRRMGTPYSNCALTP